MRTNLDKIMTNGKALFLAYDQGLEHGPSADFNDKNVAPEYIIEIAKNGKFNAVVFQKGIAEKYNEEIKKSRIPLILKLNGKTNLYKGEPLAEPICTVEEAVKLGAGAVGFTIYIGSSHEAHMMKHFANIEKEAHAKGMPVIAWIYPRGKNIKDDVSRENMAYAARVGLETGADIVKLKWNGKFDDLKWVVKSAGKCKVMIAGGIKKNEKTLLKQVKGIMDAGAAGLAIGRNVWQAEHPIELANKIREIIF